MSGIPVFLLREACLVRRQLRRWRFGCTSCPQCPQGYCDARVVVGEFKAEMIRQFDGREVYAAAPPVAAFADDPRWPTHAPCGHAFEAADHRQVMDEPLYRMPSGAIITLREAPAGACWDASWLPRKGADGRALTVRLPDGSDWCLDWRSRNCPMPDDDAHHCWVRHGDPEDGTLHVESGHAGAGAGSILTKGWHGFLHNGHLWAC